MLQRQSRVRGHGVTVTEEIQWGLIPNNSWAVVSSSEFGAGIRRVTPRLQYHQPSVIGDFYFWEQDGAKFTLDVGTATYEPERYRSLVSFADELRKQGFKVDPQHPILEALNFLADRLLQQLDHLSQSGQHIGLLAPPNIILCNQGEFGERDYQDAALLRRRHKTSGEPLSEEQKVFLREVASSRIVFLPDLGFRWPAESSNLPTWLDEKQQFAFLWDRPPVDEHVADPEPIRINRVVARIFAWTLTGKRYKHLPAISPSKRDVVGPCWDVLNNAIEGQYASIDEFRKALRSNPLSTFTFGNELDAQPRGVADRTEKKSALRFILPAMLIFLLLGALAIPFLPGAVEPFVAPDCCADLSEDANPTFVALVREYDSTLSDFTRQKSLFDNAAEGDEEKEFEELAKVIERRLTTLEELAFDEVLKARTDSERACLQSLSDGLLESTHTHFREFISLSRDVYDVAGVVRIIPQLDGLSFRVLALHIVTGTRSEEMNEKARQIYNIVDQKLMQYRSHRDMASYQWQTTERLEVSQFDDVSNVND